MRRMRGEQESFAMVKIKICGITRPEDLKAAAEADAIGIVVESPESPRNLDITEAIELARMTPPFQSVVLVTATTDERRLRRALGSLAPQSVQVPHDIDPLVLADLQVSFPDVKWLAALRPEHYEPMYDAADALVLDATTDDGYGGTGKEVDRGLARKVVEATRTRVVLAGGLTPENVADAIREVQPFAVDVSSGVESEPGKKDPEKVRAFIRAARAALG